MRFTDGNICVHKFEMGNVAELTWDNDSNQKNDAKVMRSKTSDVTFRKDSEMMNATSGFEVAAIKPSQREARQIHRQLWKSLNDVRGLCTSGDWIDGAHLELVAGFETVRDNLAMHFAVEEACANFEQIPVWTASMEQWIEDLRAERTELYQLISDVVEEAHSLCGYRFSPRKMRYEIDRFHAFDSKLIAHEAIGCFNNWVQFTYKAQ